MIDELALYNLMDEYPLTLDLVHEVERRTREETIKDFAKYLEDNSELGLVVWLYRASYVSEKMQKNSKKLDN